MLHKALSEKPGVEMHHEYAVQITQPLAVKRYLGLLDEQQTREILRETFGAAIHHSGKAHWGDSSNKLSWLIPDLAALFADARFVHLVRDGRKVASSYFHKLAAETYDDRSHAAMQAYYDSAGAMPPPEKPYWWPVPRRDDPAAAAFRAFDQFQRIAWHWAEVNRVAMEAMAALPKDRTLIRKAGRPAGIPCFGARTARFPGLALRRQRLRRLRPAAQCEPSRGQASGPGPAGAIRSDCGDHDGAPGICRPPPNTPSNY